jgi:OTU domain-containing protein 6
LHNVCVSPSCDTLVLRVFLKVTPDGHCLFAAVADQLVILGILPKEQANYTVTRTAAANYIYTHPDDFLPFLPSVDGEDGIGATDAGLMTPRQFGMYCTAIRDTGVWGGEPEILALARAYNIPIHVIQSGTPPVVVHNPTGAPNQDGGLDGNKKVVRISYHRRMYGLGEVPFSPHFANLVLKGINSTTIHYDRRKAWSKLS